MPVQWLLITIMNFAMFVLIIYIVLGWLVHFNVVNLTNRFVATLYDLSERMTQPLLAPIRRVVPPLGGVDLSAVVLAIGIGFLQRIVQETVQF